MWLSFGQEGWGNYHHMGQALASWSKNTWERQTQGHPHQSLQAQGTLLLNIYSPQEAALLLCSAKLAPDSQFNSHLTDMCQSSLPWIV